MSNNASPTAPHVSGDYSIAPPTSTSTTSDANTSVRDYSREIRRPYPLNGTQMALRGTSVSVAVDPVALITTECITVTSAMRKHARWAHSSVSSILGGSSSPMNPSFQNSRPSTPRNELAARQSQKSRTSSSFADGAVDDGGLANRWGLRGKKGKSMQDNPLMAGFARLRRELVGCKGNTHVLGTRTFLLLEKC